MAFTWTPHFRSSFSNSMILLYFNLEQQRFYPDIYTTSLIFYQRNTWLSQKKCHEFAVWKCSHKAQAWLLSPVLADLMLHAGTLTLKYVGMPMFKCALLLVKQQNNMCGSGCVTFNPWQGLNGISQTRAYHSATDRLADLSQSVAAVTQGVQGISIYVCIQCGPIHICTWIILHYIKH